MYSILKKSRLLNLSVDDQLHLFDKIVIPILLYGCEIWGFGNLDVIERVQLKFCKMVLNLKPSTPNYMIYGELGRVPMSVHIKTRIISYWSQILTGKQTKYSFILYNLLYCKFNNGYETKWMGNLKSILDSSGFSYIWVQNELMNDNTWLKNNIKQRLTDQFRQTWESNCNNSSKGITYNLFTLGNFECQNYINSTLSNFKKSILARFRTTNHRLPIETGRWVNISRENRTCVLCSSDIGDEFHFIMKCEALKNERKQYIPRYFITRPNVIKFHELFSTKKILLLNKLCKFINIINERVSPPG